MPVSQPQDADARLYARWLPVSVLDVNLDLLCEYKPGLNPFLFYCDPSAHGRLDDSKFCDVNTALAS